MRDAVERDLVRIDLCFYVLEVEERHGLLRKFVHSFLSCAGNGLECRDNDAFDLYFIVDGFEGHDQCNRSAVRVCDNAAVIAQGMGVYFRHDERDVRVHAKCA